MVWEVVVLYKKTVANELAIKTFAFKYADKTEDFRTIEGLDGKILYLRKSPEGIIGELLTNLSGTYHVYSNDTVINDVFVIDNQVVDRYMWVKKFFGGKQ